MNTERNTEMNTEADRRKNLIEKMLPTVIGILVLISGFAAAGILCRMNHIDFGLHLWPLIACIDVFVFTTIGFFLTEGKTELLYGICCIGSVACMIVQMAIFF